MVSIILALDCNSVTLVNFLFILCKDIVYFCIQTT